MGVLFLALASELLKLLFQAVHKHADDDSRDVSERLLGAPLESLLQALVNPDVENSVALSSRQKSLGNLVSGDFWQGGAPRVLSIFSSLRVSLFDLASRFFVPTHDRIEPARAEAVKDGA